MGGATSFPYPALPSRFKSLLNAAGVSRWRNASAKTTHAGPIHQGVHNIILCTLVYTAPGKCGMLVATSITFAIVILNRLDGIDFVLDVRMLLD